MSNLNFEKPEQFIGKIAEFTAHVNQHFLVLSAWNGYESGIVSYPVVMGKVVKCTKNGKQFKTAKPIVKIIKFLY